MRYVITEHALQRLAERGISEKQIEETISHPDSIKTERGVMIYQKVWHDPEDITQNKFLIRVFLNELNTPPTIVTVYKTSKLAKYL